MGQFDTWRGFITSLTIEKESEAVEKQKWVKQGIGKTTISISHVQRAVITSYNYVKTGEIRGSSNGGGQKNRKLERNTVILQLLQYHTNGGGSVLPVQRAGWEGGREEKVEDASSS